MVFMKLYYLYSEDWNVYYLNNFPSLFRILFYVISGFVPWASHLIFLSISNHDTEFKQIYW